jgi:hypothetical protein
MEEDKVMKVFNQVLVVGLNLFIMVTLLNACATIPELNVSYKIPSMSDELKGRKITLRIEDTRKNKVILGAGAQKDLKGSVNSVSLNVARPNENGFRIGTFRVDDLMREGMGRRLEALGLEVISEEMGNVPLVVIILKEFSLDLVNRKWIAKMSYDAELFQDGKKLAMQNISGQAERSKIVGRRESDAAMGEIYTDVINKLNIVRLLEQGGLL